MPLDAHHMAADNAALFASTGFAVAVEYQPGSPAEPIRAYALFGAVETASEKGGIVGDRVTAWLPVASLGATVPAARRILVQDPDGAPVSWEVVYVSAEGGRYRLELVKNARPVP